MCWKRPGNGRGLTRAHLRLLETFSLEEVHDAVGAALRLGAICFDGVKHLLLCAIERRPPKLDLENHPHLPVAEWTELLGSDRLPHHVRPWLRGMKRNDRYGAYFIFKSMEQGKTFRSSMPKYPASLTTTSTSATRCCHRC